MMDLALRSRGDMVKRPDIEQIQTQIKLLYTLYKYITVSFISCGCMTKLYLWRRAKERLPIWLFRNTTRLHITTKIDTCT
jgi:hypothetical protein